MKQNHTDITIVLDRSGSMESVASDTIGGFNEYLKRQQEAPGTATFTLNQFDDIYERVIGPVDIGQAKSLSKDTFVPRGCTALLDAIGRTITDMGTRLSMLPEPERPEKVVVVIITDGYENASREFTRDKINEMIAHQRDVYKWEFVYLGANQDAILVATGLGMAGANAMRYAGTSKGVTSAFAIASENTAMYRVGSKSSMDFTTQDRDLQQEADAE